MGSLMHWHLLFVLKCFFSLVVHFFTLWSLCGFQFWAHDYIFGFIYIFMLKFMDHPGHNSFSILDIELIALFTWCNCGENCMNFKFCKHLSSARFIFIASNGFSTYGLVPKPNDCSTLNRILSSLVDFFYFGIAIFYMAIN